jgi:zinc finger BED domain-containing protein 4
MISDTFLNRPNTSHFGVGTTKDVMFGRLLKRFEKVIKDKNFLIATFLDPRFELLFFKPENKETVKKIILNILSSFNNLNSNIEESTNNTSTVETLNAAENKESLWDFYKEITSKSIPTEAPGSLNYTVLDDYHNFNRVLVVEFEKYCNMKCISIDDDPLGWWKINFESLPLIGNKLLIQKYLSAPASSVYSERSFSEAGLVYEAKINRLQPQIAEQLLFVHHNINKF